MVEKNDQEGSGTPQPAPATEATGQAQAGTVSKIEGVRRALKELGKNAKPSAIQAFVKEHFNIDMTKDHISVSKGEIRRQAARKKKKAKTMKKAPGKPRATKAKAAAKGKGLTKIEAIRRTLRALGKNAKPLDIQGYLKKHFEIELTRELITKYRGDLFRKKAKKRAKAKAAKAKAEPVVVKSKPRKAPKAKPQLKPAPSAATKGTIMVEDVQTVKGLLKRVGPTKLRSLIELLGK